MKKSGFTLQEHRDVGAQMEQIRNALTTISIAIYNSYPMKAVSPDLYKATKFVDKVRSELDDQVYIENPTLDSKVADHIYYDTARKAQERMK